MQSALKITLWILVVIVVAGGIYYWYQNARSNAPAAPTPVATSTGNGAPASVLPSGSDTSDAALNQDLSGMDTQLSAMSADTASIDSGMNDQPIPQQ